MLGDVFPDFVVHEGFQGKTTVDKLIEHKPTMFVVLRYIGCTVCRYVVHMLTKRIQEFKDKGVNVCVVMQSKSKNVKKDLAGKQLLFPLICDTHMTLYNSLDIEPANSMEELVDKDMDALKIKSIKAKACGFVHGIYEGNAQQLPAFFYVDENRKVLVVHYAKTIVDMLSYIQ